MALKVGIIGNGGIANAHMDGYKALCDEVELVACCDINFPKAKAYAERRINIAESLEKHAYHRTPRFRVEGGRTIAMNIA